MLGWVPPWAFLVSSMPKLCFDKLFLYDYDVLLCLAHLHEMSVISASQLCT